jgi:hypothetical protein
MPSICREKDRETFNAFGLTVYWSVFENMVNPVHVGYISPNEREGGEAASSRGRSDLAERVRFKVKWLKS